MTAIAARIANFAFDWVTELIQKNVPPATQTVSHQGLFAWIHERALYTPLSDKSGITFIVCQQGIVGMFLQKRSAE